MNETWSVSDALQQNLTLLFRNQLDIFDNELRPYSKRERRMNNESDSDLKLTPLTYRPCKRHREK